jgi:hypothetical protein
MHIVVALYVIFSQQMAIFIIDWNRGARSGHDQRRALSRAANSCTQKKAGPHARPGFMLAWRRSRQGLTGATVLHGGNWAYYNISQDFVQMPPFENFRDAEGYYATRAHEMTHWTRHKSRLDRDFGRKRFGDEGYAMEELVAELGWAFLSADLELKPEVRKDHASYTASWIKVLKDNKRAILTAASHAQRATDYLHKLQAPVVTQSDAAWRVASRRNVVSNFDLNRPVRLKKYFAMRRFTPWLSGMTTAI